MNKKKTVSRKKKTHRPPGVCNDPVMSIDSVPVSAVVAAASTEIERLQSENAKLASGRVSLAFEFSGIRLTYNGPQIVPQGVDAGGVK